MKAGLWYAVEGDSGTRTIDVPVTLSAPSGKTVTVDWSTLDGLGQPEPDVDFEAATGTVTFLPGETAKSVPFTVIGDLDDEPGILWGAEWGGIKLDNPTNAGFAGANPPIGIALIVDDDG